MNDGIGIDLKFKNSVTGQNKLEKYAETLGQIYALLNAMDKQKINTINVGIKETNQQIKKTKKTSNSLGKSIALAFEVQNIKTFVSVVKRLVTGMTSLTDKSADYLENLNLIDVAFKNDTNQASRLVNKLSEMYGLDESWGYRQVGIFKQLANAMGLSDETGTKLAKTLTQLAIDTSSLYNFSVDEASQILQSGLAGQTKPVRRLGGDITQNTLQLVLEEHGIDKSISDLSYMEKRLVIVTALLDQTKEAHGDWGRTIESISNQEKILSQQLEKLGRSIGNVFLPILKTILPYLNAIVMVLSELFDILAKLVGYNEEDFNFVGENDISDYINEIGGSADKTSEKVKNLKQGLRSFDKLNNITTPTDNSSKNSGSGSGNGGMSDDILAMFNKTSDNYLNSLDKIQMKATKIRDSIMEWLGFEKQIDPLTGDIYFKFKKITGGTILGALAVGGVIYLGIKTIVKLLGTTLLSKIPFIKTNAGAISLAIMGCVTGITLLKDGFKSLGVEGGNAYNKLVAGAGAVTGSFALMGAKIGGIKGAITGGLIGAFTSLYTTWKEGMKSVKKAQNYFREIYVKEMDEMIEKNNELKQSLTTQMVDYNTGYKLLDLLRDITDENGNIQKGYETRAKNIIDAINETYGTEYKVAKNTITLNDKVVKSVGAIEKSIDKLVVKKKAEMVLDAYKEQYMENMQKRKEAYDNLIKKQNEYNNAINNETLRKQQGEKAYKHYIETLEIQMGQLKDNYKTYTDEIDKYDKLLTDNMSGNVKDLEDDLKEYGVLTKEEINDQLGRIETGSRDTADKVKKNWEKKIDELQASLKKKGIVINIDANTKSALTNITSLVTSVSKTINSNPTLSALTKVAESKLKTTANSVAKAFGISFNADGGLPPVGQLFVANERGPELIGSLGGQSFVANQKQVLDMIGRNSNNSQPINATFVVQVGNKQIAKQVINDLQSIAKNNGKPITIG